MNKLLVVDLCGTIVRKNTTHDFMLNSTLPMPRRIVARLILSRAAGFLYNRINPALQKRSLIALLRGISQPELVQLARDYADTALASYPRAEVLHKIRRAQDEGVSVVLASASLDFIVAAFASALGVDVAVSTKLYYSDKGCCAGSVKLDATGNKLHGLRKFLGRDDVEFDVITDNPEDTDLMSVATHSWFIDADT